MPPPGAGRHGGQLSLAFRIALRELRARPAGLGIFVVCIALGVAAIAAIGSLAAAFDSALVANGRILVGGDLSFELVNRRAKAGERKVLDDMGEISESAGLRAMARSLPGQANGEAGGGRSALVEIKAVDDSFPLFGDVTVKAPDGGLKTSTAWRTPGEVLVESTLLDRLGGHVGDKLAVGETTVTIAGILGEQPDRLADRLAYGPRILMSLKTLQRTALVQPGSVIRWTYRLRLPDNGGLDETRLAAAKAKLQKSFPESGFAIHDWTDPAPSLRRDAARFSQFVGLVGLTALLLGGIGVGNAIHAYMAKKRDVIAIFKSLGASSRLVLQIYLIQAVLLTLAGIVIGLALGAATPWIVTALYPDLLPVHLALGPHPAPLAMAAMAGLLTMALFVLWPLGRARAVPPATLMRADLAEAETRIAAAWPFAAASATAGLLLLAIAILSSDQPFTTAAICAGIVFGFALFFGLAYALQRLAARFAGRFGADAPVALTLALASIKGPGSLARAVSLSLGLGLSLLVAIALINQSLVKELSGEIAEDAPAYYFLDIDPADLTDFRSTAEAAVPGAKLDDAPMLRGRIVALKGVPADKVKGADEFQWVLNGDRGLTYTDTVPDASKVVQGEWWRKDYSGPPIVSFDDAAAKGLGLKVGDTITVNVLGRNLDARIANLRKIDWESLAINFIMVFPPSTLQGAPHRMLAALQLPDNTTAAEEGRLIQALADRFPLVTAIKIGDVVAAARTIVGKVMTAIEVTAVITLLIGAVVLAGAIASGQERRKYLAVLYKTLGATRRRIVGAELLEFSLLGISVALASLVVASITAYLLCRYAFELPFAFSGLAALETVAFALALVLGLGAVATWRVLSAKAAPYLRAE